MPAVGAVIGAAFLPFVALIGRRPAPLDLDVAAAVATRLVLVAEDAGEIVGALVADTRADSGTEMFVDTVAVLPEAQRRGVGRALIAAAEQAARHARTQRVVLYTNAAMAGALALYPRLGYAQTHRDQASGFDRVHFAKAMRPALALRAPVDALYGRRRVHGHGLDALYDRYALDLGVPANLAAMFPGVGEVRLEVGFGAGEHLVDHARRAPNVGMIGVEPFETGMMRAVRDVAAGEIGNVRVHLGDARRVLDWLPPGSLARVDVLYPDPWPKQRHWKRRFISTDGLDRLARVLREGGKIRFASDIAHYVDWVRAHVAAHPAFVLERDAGEPWPDWPGTRYEAKALREGRAPRYLTLRRT